MINRQRRFVTPVRSALAAAVALWPAVSAAQQELVIDRDNIVVSQSVRIKPGRYRIKDKDGNGVLQVKADNVVVDFQGATLAAMELDGADLSKAEGIGIAINGTRNVTIRNANVHGYFFNIRAANAPGLKLDGCDVSYSRAQRIGAGGQPVPIWLHLRSVQAWRSYGAGIWMEDSGRSVVRECRGSGAQNGLLLVDSSDCTVTQCDFSFNSGFGIGLWGASRNVVAWNMIDFVNRPWGGGWGGDSAALVVVNDSHDNYLVGNSMTHSGDGFFLTDRVNGGFDHKNQTTNIQGSCDRNIISYNDGSWSTANAFEGTFSVGNIYYRNFANDSNYGFWLGYSNDSLLLENEVLRHNYEGIAIEQGAGTRVEGNTFADIRGSAIALWSRGGWVDKLHPSRDIEIRDNLIRNCGRSFRLNNSTEVSVGGNTIENAPEPEFDYLERPPTRALAAFKASERYTRLQEILAARPTSFVMLRDRHGPQGIDWLQVDDFSTRDYRGQLAAWRHKDAATLELFPLVSGDLNFSTPDWITVTPDRESKLYLATAKPAAGLGEWKAYSIEISLKGSPRTQQLAGRFLTAEWDVRWYRWDRPTKLAYDDDVAWARLFGSEPIYRQTTREVSKKLWSGGFPDGVPHSHFAILAKTKIKLPGGRYRLSTLSDDGIRVFLDGKEVISRWTHHGPTPDRTEIEIAQGGHEFVIHYCQEGGASALTFGWQKLDK
ncbi:MAG: right-handed parallel beta-helix repeat-containing protein [Phycisphaerae bacterium]